MLSSKINVLFNTTFTMTVMTYYLQTTTCRHKPRIWKKLLCLVFHVDQRYQMPDKLKEAPSIIGSKKLLYENRQSEKAVVLGHTVL